jgi:glycosyltransferase involved in cell wall biosynthesis
LSTRTRASVVSILIPTYNRAALVARAVDSACAQTWLRCEVIVVDDHSTDDTPDVLAAAAGDRLLYRRQAVRSGTLLSWTAGLHEATGDYVVFLADDDLIAPDFVARRVASLESRPSAVVAFSGYELHDLDGALVSRVGMHVDRVCELDGDGLLHAALSREWFIGAALYRRSHVLELWEDVMGDDLVFDFSLNLRLALTNDASGVAIPEYDAFVTAHPGQNSNARRDEVYQQTEAVLRRLLDVAPVRHTALLRRELANWLTVQGRQLASQGRRGAALRELARALAADPKAPAPWWQLALLALPGQSRASGAAGGHRGAVVGDRS